MTTKSQIGQLRQWLNEDRIDPLMGYSDDVSTSDRLEKIMELIRQEKISVLKRVSSHYGYAEETNIHWSELDDYIDNLINQIKEGKWPITHQMK